MAKAEMIFPRDFLWGAATSAHQVEGGNTNNDWWQWENEGHIVNGEKSGPACNWWEAAEDDLDRATEIGLSAMRLSVEWSRVEPEPGQFDEEALARYREILKAVIKRGMEPMVTLHHFTNPLWLTEMGDFNSDNVVQYFADYVAKAVSALGDLVPKWITINEPMVYFILRYLAGVFPESSKNSWRGGMEAVRNMLRCHAVAYHAIKEAQPQAHVGVAKNYLLIQPAPNSSLISHWWARRVHRFLNQNWMSSMVTGHLQWPVGRGAIKGLAESFDFVGINYFSRFQVSFPPRPSKIFDRKESPESLMSDGDFFEIYPEGLFAAIKENLQYQKPIYITENGLPDKEDRLRSDHLLSHLREIWRAINFSFPVMGYYYWTLTDNFEWDRGWTQRFGLIEMDPDTQVRIWRKSAQLYHEICKQNAINSEMTERFAPQLMDTLFPGEAPSNR